MPKSVWRHTRMSHIPLLARGQTYWLTRHAFNRSLEMRISCEILAHVLQYGEVVQAPEKSKYRGAKVFHMGKVAIATAPDDQFTLTTVLWATAADWDAFEPLEGRARRDSTHTAHVLAQWK